MSGAERPPGNLPGLLPGDVSGWRSSPAGEVEGTLEELDGTPIVPAGRPARRKGVSWTRGVMAAAAATAGRPGLWAYALVAFLARGGLLMLALPTVVLPTFVGLANVVGPASVSASGPGPRLVALVAAGAAACVVLAVAGTLVAAAAEAALHRATVAPDPATSRGPDIAFGGTLALASPRTAFARAAVIRLVLLVPLAAATAVAVPAWVAVAYRELTLPSDLFTALAPRILGGAPAATGLVAIAWLASEVVGGFATRRAVLLDATVPRALAASLGDPLRAPVGTVLSVLVALAGTVLALAPAVWSLAAAWDMARRALVDDAGTLDALLATVLLAAAWLGALLLAGIAAAWRDLLATAELLRR